MTRCSLVMIVIGVLALATGAGAFEERLGARVEVGNQLGSQFGHSVAIYTDTVAVGLPYFDADAPESTDVGAVWLFQWTGTRWEERNFFDRSYPMERDAYDQFGWSVALWGDWGVVGTPYRHVQQGLDLITLGGYYPLERPPGVWSWDLEDPEHTIPVWSESSDYGYALDLWGDNAIVAAPQYGSAEGVIEFAHQPFNWESDGAFAGSDTDASDAFGWSVALGANRAVVGAPGANGVGAAYVFVLSGGTWTQEAKLLATTPPRGAPPGALALGRFGEAVDIDGPGNMVLVGDPAEAEAGAVYIFERSGSDWSFVERFEPGAGRVGEDYGAAVAWSTEKRFVVGAPIADDPTRGDDVGVVYAYDHSPTSGEWTLVGRVAACDGRAGARHGRALATFGGTIVVGAPWYDSARGAAYVYTRWGDLTRSPDAIFAQGFEGGELDCWANVVGSRGSGESDRRSLERSHPRHPSAAASAAVGSGA